MQNFSLESLNHLNKDLFASNIESGDINITGCFNIEARSDFQVSYLCAFFWAFSILIIIHTKGNNPLAILDFWCVWRNSHQCGMSRQLFDNDDPQKSQLGERIPFPSYLALLHRQFLSSDKHHHNFPSFRIR